jgi:hypothetical protein
MSDSFVRQQTASNANNAKEERIREIDRLVSEIDALLGKGREGKNSINGGHDPGILSEGEMIYWADRQLERNSLLAERYRLTKKTA